MNKLMWFPISLLIGLSVASAHAQMSVEVGRGVVYTDSTMVLLGLTLPAKPVFGTSSYWQYNLGGWDGRRETSVGGLARGLEWRLPTSLFRLSSGVSLISATNGRLSSTFEFYEQFLVQKRFADTNIALSYRHWSNANIKLPNLGMDFVGFQMEKKW